MRTRQRQTAADILAFRAEVERLRGQLSLTAPRRAEAAVCPYADSARANTAALHGGGGEKCPECWSVKVVRITPEPPGPCGWGFRCITCGHRWNLSVEDAAMDDINNPGRMESDR